MINLLQVSGANVMTYELEWVEGGIRSSGNRQHQVYLEKMCKQLEDTLENHLNNDLHAIQSKDEKMKLYEEISHHVSFCQQR